MLNKDIANIILNVISITALITLFFFTYATSLEEQIVKEQIDYIVEDLVDFTKILPREINTTVKNTVSMIQFPDMREYDEKVEMKNKELVKSTSALVGSVTIMGFSLVYAMSKKYDFDFMDMMKKNLIVLFFVGITGFMFVRFIAKNFRSGDPNHVKKYILTVFKKVSQ